MTRERGHYGPLDHERHPVIGWASQRAVEYGRDRAISAALQPTLPVILTATRTSRATRRLWVGSSMVGGRAEAEKPLSRIGQEFYHSVRDRDRAITTMTSHFAALVSDLILWLAANKTAPNAPSAVQWFAADVTPTLEEWREFVRCETKSWWTRAATSWDTFEKWWRKIRELRSLARAHGILLQSPEPEPLPKTIWQRSEQGNGSSAATLLGVLKIGVFGTLTIMGMVSLLSVLKDLGGSKAVSEPKG